MTLSYTFHPEDEQRLLQIAGRLTMRMPFLIVLAAVAPLFIFAGIAVATEEVLPGILVAVIGIGLGFQVIAQFRARTLIVQRFRESIGSSFPCSWVLDDAGISSADQKEKIAWSLFSQALICPEGLVLTGNAFAWIPQEAFTGSEDLPSVRKLLLKHRIRYEERA